MKLLRQTVAVTAIGISTLPQRRGTTLVIFVGMMSVVAVLLSMLSITEGVASAYVRPSDPELAVVMDSAAPYEGTTNISRAAYDTILAAPGIAKRPDGTLLVDGELRVPVPPVEGFVSGSLAIRAIGPLGLPLQPRLKLVAGRMFRAGAQELVIGRNIARKFGLPLGSRISAPGGEWPIVGVFSDEGSRVENFLLGDAGTVMSAVRQSNYGWVLVRLQNPAAFPVFEHWLRANPALSVLAERLADHEQRLAGSDFGQFVRMTYGIAVIMAVGALFGTVKNMYAAVRARTREIGTLRALGYGALPVATSILVEAVLISALGALAGALLAWVAFDGREVYIWGIFKLRVTGSLVALGLAWSTVVALLGGLFPALRASRIPAAEALRAA
jgi:putative ABC transport system permease protein